MRIAFSVVLLSLYRLSPACFLVFQAGKYRRVLYQAVIIPLWISYLVRAYAWKVIFGNEGVMNTLLLWCHATRHPLASSCTAPSPSSSPLPTSMRLRSPAGGCFAEKIRLS